MYKPRHTQLSSSILVWCRWCQRVLSSQRYVTSSRWIASDFLSLEDRDGCLMICLLNRRHSLLLEFSRCTKTREWRTAWHERCRERRYFGRIEEKKATQKAARRRRLSFSLMKSTSNGVRKRANERASKREKEKAIWVTKRRKWFLCFFP